MNPVALRIALAIGAAIDLFVGVLLVGFQPLLGPVLGFATTDTALATVAGGEYVVAGLLYVAILRDPAGLRALLWLAALDQAFAVALPALEIARGHVAATPKTVGPMPVSLALAAVFAIAAARGAGPALVARRYTR